MLQRRSAITAGVATTYGAMVWSQKPEARSITGRHRRIPDVEVQAHDGSTYRFYSDLINERVVLINFMFVGCGDVCPLITANLRQVQDLLGGRVGRDIFMYSITLQPELETPEILGDYAAQHAVGPGWLFLTGEPASIEELRWALGFGNIDPELDIIKDEHTGLLRYGNDKLDRWSGCPALSRPEWIVKSITSSVAVG